MPRNDEILKKRAQELAKPIESQTTTGKFVEILVFKLGNEQYALETQYLNEVYNLKDYTPVPCTPPFIYGITSVRRKIMTILDFRVLLEIPKTDQSGKKIVILSDNETELAILIDEFMGIRKLVLDELQSSLPTLTGIKQDFLKGLLLDGTVILDGGKILNSKMFVVDQTVEL